MSEFWYALASGIGADAFPPLRRDSALRVRRYLTERAEDTEKTPRQAKSGGESRGRPRRLAQLPCTP
jgi:hypothetical protein